MQLNSTYRAALLQILSDERNHKISLQTGYFHGEPVFKISYVFQGVQCVRTVSITEHAKKLGWKQCDYPHKLALDMWFHPNMEQCDDGRYISTEEMLEIINTQAETL